ncbi:MAG: hypothetical protein ABIR79_15225 [Candidatus Binatia bacterium]
MLALTAAPALAATSCDLSFHLEGWSAFYKTAHGWGRVTCDNGQVRRVALRMQGGGLTVGRSEINGRGDFSSVADIREVYGSYANAEVHAGVVKSSAAQVVTKGTVSLAFAGKGRGVDLGVAFGKLTIAPVNSRSRRHR